MLTTGTLIQEINELGNSYCLHLLKTSLHQLENLNKICIKMYLISKDCCQ